MSDFEKLINASDLIEWIIETDPDWCVGSVRCIIDHIDKMPSAQSTMGQVFDGDTINRQAAIEAHYEYCNKHPDAGFPVWSLKILEDLPSAQPETHEKRTETHACDLIDRQTAIDAILAVTGNSSVRELYEHVQEHELSDMWSGGVNAAIDIIIAVPSAQPDSKETSPTHKALDTISRQAVIEINRSYHGQMPNEVNHRIWKEINELPSAQPEPKWIPCSERLPEEGQEILATTTDNAWGDVVIIRTYYKEMHKSVLHGCHYQNRMQKGEPMRNDYITRLVQICLDIANITDERGEAGEPYFKELGLGYRALSGILRRGCKEIIDLQNNYHGAIEAKNLAKIGEQEAHDILEEMFGDREVYTINDKDKERIKAFVRSITDEWERRTDEQN